MLDNGKDAKVAAMLAQSAVAKMVDLGIAPTPNNYTVWYTYFADSFPDLKSAVNAIIADTDAMTAQQCEELFERFFTFDQEGTALYNTTNRMEQALTKAVEYLGDAGADAAVLGTVLEGASGELSRHPADANLQVIIDGVLTATREMEEHTRELERKLADSGAEVSQLRLEVEATRREASTDSLTGIANRKMFDMRLRQDATSAVENGTSLCLLMVDIDHFKKFNDSHGHQTGDQVLKLLANTLTESIKGQDTAARYGGEEFCVILPNTEIEPAAHLANEIRNRLASKNIVNRRTGEQLGTITLSIGVSKLVPGEMVPNLITRVDLALYAAKNTGRNKVMTERELDDSDK